VKSAAQSDAYRVRQEELLHSVEDEIQKLRESRKSNWINSVVLPVAFQWIEEHKEDVYRNMSPKNTDDIGVVMEAAFKPVQQLPAYKVGQAKSAAYEAAIAAGTWDPIGDQSGVDGTCENDPAPDATGIYRAIESYPRYPQGTLVHGRGMQLPGTAFPHRFTTALVFAEQHVHFR
jgi:hypothetical protein